MIDGGLKDEHRSAIIDVIAANDRVERAVLFGSRAMGTNTVTSDVDIALYGHSLTLTDQVRLAEAIDDIPMAQSVELVLYDSIDNPAFREHIQTHGVEWYRRAKADRLDLLSKHRRILEALLRTHLPDVEVWAYGSRVNGRSHDGSDLDLVLRGPGLKKIPIDQLGEFEEAVRESNISFLVEARDWARLPERFHREFERDHVVLVGSGPWRGIPDWREAVLADVADFLSGGTPSKSQPAYWNGSIPWVSAKDMKCFRLHDTEDHVTAEGLANGTRMVPAGSVLLLTRGMTLLKGLPVCVTEKPMTFNQDVKALRPKPGIDPGFLPYLVLGNKGRLLRLVDLAGHGTGRINSDELKSFDIHLPPPHEQRAIAHVLGTLDEKIELNRHMNETLEEMARGLFTSWFVNFDPVRAKMEGRDPSLPPHLAGLFPNNFVDSELGKIPDGWEVGELGDYVNAAKGISYKGSGLRDEGVPLHNLNSVNEGGGYKYDGVKYYTGEYQERHMVRPRDLIVANTEQGHDRVLIGYSALIPDMFGDHGIASHHVFIVRPRSDSPLTATYLCHLFNSRQLHDVVSRYANGTTVNMLPIDGVLMPRIVCPPKSLVSAFDSMTLTMYDQENSSVSESATLSSLRNSLLPLLVSGQLCISGSLARFESSDL